METGRTLPPVRVSNLLSRSSFDESEAPFEHAPETRPSVPAPLPAESPAPGRTPGEGRAGTARPLHDRGPDRRGRYGDRLRWTRRTRTARGGQNRARKICSQTQPP